MRWKLLFVAPLLAAAAGTGVGELLGRFIFTGPTAGVVIGTVPPAIAAAGAGIFVYRHTPRRRALQAAVAAGLSFALTLALLLATASLL